jgi:hypothetical protein
VTLLTSTSAEYCFNQPLGEFLDFYDVICEEAERLKKEAKAGGYK